MNKIILSTLLIIGLVGMIGTAAANPEIIIINPGDQTLVHNQNVASGTYSTYDIELIHIVSNTSGNVHTISATTTDVITGSGAINDLIYRFHYGGTSSVWLNSGDTWTWTDTATPTPSTLITETLTLDVMDTGSATNSQYQFQVYDEYQLGCGTSDNSTGTVYGTSIPEFPTVALPIAAILGLMFIISSRKKKE